MTSTWRTMQGLNTYGGGYSLRKKHRADRWFKGKAGDEITAKMCRKKSKTYKIRSGPSPWTPGETLEHYPEIHPWHVKNAEALIAKINLYWESKGLPTKVNITNEMRKKYGPKQ